MATKSTSAKKGGNKAAGGQVRPNADAPKRGAKKPLTPEQLAAVALADKSKRLSPKQERFVAEYLIDLNATQAAIRAGYSHKTAGSQAFDLLKKPEIQAAIDAARKRTADKLEITRERILAEYAKLAFVDPRRFYNEDGSLKAVTDLDDDTAAALSGIEIDEINAAPGSPPLGYSKKVKWHDKRAALDSIARLMGWNQDKLKLQGDAEQPIQVSTKVVIVPQKQTAEVITKPLDKAGD